MRYSKLRSKAAPAVFPRPLPEVPVYRLTYTTVRVEQNTGRDKRYHTMRSTYVIFFNPVSKIRITSFKI